MNVLLRRIIQLSLLLTIVALNVPGFAQTAADRTTARTLAGEGQQALIDGDFDRSAERFERAVTLISAPTLRLGLARARVGQGRLVEAYEIYQVVSRETPAANAPQAFRRAVIAAKNELEEVAVRLAWITIRVEGPKGEEAPTVTLNDVPVASASLGVKRPVDPGPLTVRAELDGYEPTSESLEIAEGEGDTVIELKLLALPEPTRKSAKKPTSATRGGAAVNTDVEDFQIPYRPISYGLVGLGGAGLIAAGVTGTLAWLESDALSERCPDPNNCEVPQSRIDDYNLLQLAWMASAGAGGVLVGTGVALYLLFPEADEQSSAIRPFVAHNLVGLSGRF